VLFVVAVAVVNVARIVVGMLAVLLVMVVAVSVLFVVAVIIVDMAGIVVGMLAVLLMVVVVVRVLLVVAMIIVDVAGIVVGMLAVLLMVMVVVRVLLVVAVIVVDVTGIVVGMLAVLLVMIVAVRVLLVITMIVVDMAGIVVGVLAAFLVVVVIVAAVLVVHVAVVVFILFLIHDRGVHLHHALQAECVEVQDLFQGSARLLGLDQSRKGVHRLDAVLHVLQLFFIHEIQLVENDAVGEGNLLLGLVHIPVGTRLIQMNANVLRVNQAHHTVDAVVVLDEGVAVESENDRGRIGQASGLNDDRVEVLATASQHSESTH
jgi:hypothetical protein